MPLLKKFDIANVFIYTFDLVLEQENQNTLIPAFS